LARKNCVLDRIGILAANTPLDVRGSPGVA